MKEFLDDAWFLIKVILVAIVVDLLPSVIFVGVVCWIVIKLFFK